MRGLVGSIDEVDARRRASLMKSTCSQVAPPSVERKTPRSAVRAPGVAERRDVDDVGVAAGGRGRWPMWRVSRRPTLRQVRPPSVDLVDAVAVGDVAADASSRRCRRRSRSGRTARRRARRPRRSRRSRRRRSASRCRRRSSSRRRRRRRRSRRSAGRGIAGDGDDAPAAVRADAAPVERAKALAQGRRSRVRHCPPVLPLLITDYWPWAARRPLSHKGKKGARTYPKDRGFGYTRGGGVAGATGQAVAGSIR